MKELCKRLQVMAVSTIPMKQAFPAAAQAKQVLTYRVNLARSPRRGPRTHREYESYRHACAGIPSARVRIR